MMLIHLQYKLESTCKSYSDFLKCVMTTDIVSQVDSDLMESHMDIFKDLNNSCSQSGK